MATECRYHAPSTGGLFTNDRLAEIWGTNSADGGFSEAANGSVGIFGVSQKDSPRIGQNLFSQFFTPSQCSNNIEMSSKKNERSLAQSRLYSCWSHPEEDSENRNGSGKGSEREGAGEEQQRPHISAWDNVWEWVQQSSCTSGAVERKQVRVGNGFKGELSEREKNVGGGLTFEFISIFDFTV